MNTVTTPIRILSEFFEQMSLVYVSLKFSREGTKSNSIWDNILSKWIVCKAPKCKRRLNRQGDKYQHVFYHEKLPMWDSMSTNYPSRSIHSKELGANSSFFVAGCLLILAFSSLNNKHIPTNNPASKEMILINPTHFVQL